MKPLIPESWECEDITFVGKWNEALVHDYLCYTTALITIRDIQISVFPLNRREKKPKGKMCEDVFIHFIIFIAILLYFSSSKTKKNKTTTKNTTYRLSKLFL